MLCALPLQYGDTRGGRGGGAKQFCDSALTAHFSDGEAHAT